jgi:hypothetical protein
LLGLLCYEKLSNVVLVPVVVLLLAGSRHRKDTQFLLAGVCGLVAGALPLIAANLETLHVHDSAVSLWGAHAPAHLSWGGLFAFLTQVCGMGVLRAKQEWLFGASSFPATETVEAVLFTVLFVLSVVSTARPWRDARDRTVTRLLLAASALLVVLLYALPGPYPTESRHWIVILPFVSVAFAMTVREAVHQQRIGWAILVVCALLVLNRLVAVASIERFVWQGNTSQILDPSLTTMARFAQQQEDHAVFVPVDWGIGAQIYALSGADDRTVFEIYDRYAGPAMLAKYLDYSGKNTAYLLVPEHPTGNWPQSTLAMQRDMRALSGWREVPVEEQIAHLASVQVWKFERTAPPGRVP